MLRQAPEDGAFVKSISVSEYRAFFHDYATLEATVVSQDDIFFDDAERPNVHVRAQSSSAVNNSGGMNRHNFCPKIVFEAWR